MKVKAVKAGDRITILQTVTVEPACEENNGIWYCVTHRKSFRNNLEKGTHIYTGNHTLAWFCFEDTAYEDPGPQK